MKLANFNMLVLKTKLHLPNENDPFFVVFARNATSFLPNDLRVFIFLEDQWFNGGTWSHQTVDRCDLEKEVSPLKNFMNQYYIRWKWSENEWSFPKIQEGSIPKIILVLAFFLVKSNAFHTSWVSAGLPTWYTWSSCGSCAAKKNRLACKREDVNSWKSWWSSGNPTESRGYHDRPSPSPADLPCIGSIFLEDLNLKDMVLWLTHVAPHVIF